MEYKQNGRFADTLAAETAELYDSARHQAVVLCPRTC